MDSRRRLSGGHNNSRGSNKLKFDALNKILKVDIRKRDHKKDKLAPRVPRATLSESFQSNATAPTPSRSILEVPDFKSFLADETNVDEFREFLKTQYCAENLDFYFACERFRRLDRDKVGKEMIKFMANQIYNDYLSENARQPVNLDYQCLQNIKWQKGNPDQNLFFDAQMEVFNLMRTDCYPRFFKWLKQQELQSSVVLSTNTSRLTSNNDESRQSVDKDAKKTLWFGQKVYLKYNNKIR